MLIGIGALVLTEICGSVYREWIYTNHYFDVGLANYLPSITGTITAVFILCGISKKFPADILQSSLGVTAGCAVYELLQPLLHTGIFDWQDLTAVIVTGALIQFIFRSLAKYQNDSGDDRPSSSP